MQIQRPLNRGAMRAATRAALATCTAVAAFAAAACQKPATAPTGEDLPNMVAERTMYGMETFRDTDGVRRARTHADTAYVFTRDSSLVQLHGLKMELYDESGRKSGTVTSRAGTIYTQSKLMVARGDVVLVTPEGKRVETQELHYDPTSHRVWSTVHTSIRNADGSVQQMNSFTTDDKFRNFSASGAHGPTGIKF